MFTIIFSNFTRWSLKIFHNKILHNTVISFNAAIALQAWN